MYLYNPFVNWNVGYFRAKTKSLRNTKNKQLSCFIVLYPTKICYVIVHRFCSGINYNPYLFSANFPNVIKSCFSTANSDLNHLLPQY